ncbi:VRR-NUC domain-containing protein [Parapusillimonas sp. JC17]|uniref:VRR-NUC domain-containing protein n=1 Tax=Parapusillimonas sp. JC17 TaxID=3445768 RepID=UPI003F9EF848
MRESQIEARLVRRIRELGGIAYKFTSPARRSVPDRLCIMPGGLAFFVECKRPGERPTEAQHREHDRLRALGQTVLVVDSYESVDRTVDLYARSPL